MKKLLLGILALVSLPLSLSAQTASSEGNSRGILGPLSIDMGFFGTIRQHDMNELGLKYNVAYEVVRNLKVTAHFETSVGLRDRNDTKHYFSSNALAGGLGYVLATDDRGGSWEARGFVGHSVGNVDWKNTFYSTEIVWKMRGGLSPTLSLGFTHKNSNTTGIPNMNMVHASIGLIF
ncbi:MAG: hypothetical protein PUH24_05880 [Prevotellaceae bacterium]|nr:hypothetical protein [Prevotellaceae bacterium]